MNEFTLTVTKRIRHSNNRVFEEYNKEPENFGINNTHFDAALLNIVRVCEQTLDLANHVIRIYKLGIPNSSADSFELLRQKNIISPELADKLKKMTHFRNTAIHQYEAVNIAIVRHVIENDLKDLINFTDLIIAYNKNNPE